MHTELTEPGAKRQQSTSQATCMTYHSLDSFLTQGKNLLADGPVAMIFAEDEVELTSTLTHHDRCGFKTVLLFAPDAFELPGDIPPSVCRIGLDCARPQMVFEAINRVIEAAPGLWLYYCYNAEFLFYPFCETRSVGEMLTFHAEERRDAMLSFVIDLYAGDLETCPTAVSRDQAYMDRSGYYALTRTAPATGADLERQQDFFGGLRWRFEEHVPTTSRRIDRVSLFKARRGLRLQSDHTFNDPEYNTYACPWHHNLTAAVCSFRTAKALKRNPGSAREIATFRWHNSTRFEWQSRQLLDLGLIEPGQWF